MADDNKKDDQIRDRLASYFNAAGSSDEKKNPEEEQKEVKPVPDAEDKKNSEDSSAAENTEDGAVAEDKEDEDMAEQALSAYEQALNSRDVSDNDPVDLPEQDEEEVASLKDDDSDKAVVEEDVLEAPSDVSEEPLQEKEDSDVTPDDEEGQPITSDKEDFDEADSDDAESEPSEEPEPVDSDSSVSEQGESTAEAEPLSDSENQKPSGDAVTQEDEVIGADQQRAVDPATEELTKALSEPVEKKPESSPSETADADKSSENSEKSKKDSDQKSDNDKHKKRVNDKIRDFFLSASALVGVDIGFSSIKLVQLNYNGRAVTLGGFGYKKIPFDLRAKEKAREDFIVRSVKDLMREQGMNALNAVTVVTGQGVSINSLLVPKMGAKELKGAAALELKKTIPFDLQDAVFDYIVGGEVFDRGGAKVEVIAVAVQKHIIQKKLELIERAGLKPVQILITPFALSNVLDKVVTAEEDEVIAVADMGSRFTTISFYKNGKLQFAREISTAGDHITQSMVRTITTESGRITITIEEAERLKAKWGIPTKKDAESDDAEQEVLAIAQIAAMMRPVLERLMTEVKRSINYYRQSFKITKISRLFITGGSSRLRNLKEYFSRNLVDVKIETLDSLNIISGWTDHQKANQELLEEQMPNLAIAFGTALSKKPVMNLMPFEAKLQQKLELVKFALHVSVPIITLILLVFYATFYTQVAKYRKLVDSAQFHIEKLRPTVEKIQDYDRMRQAIEERKALLEKAVGRQPLWSGILKELSLTTPDGVILSRLSIVQGTQPLKIRLEGDIYPTYTSIDLALSQYMITLDESPFFSKVELIATTRDPYSPTPKASFELICKLVY